MTRIANLSHQLELQAARVLKPLYQGCRAFTQAARERGVAAPTVARQNVADEILAGFKNARLALQAAPGGWYHPATEGGVAPCGGRLIPDGNRESVVCRRVRSDEAATTG